MPEERNKKHLKGKEEYIRNETFAGKKTYLHNTHKFKKIVGQTVLSWSLKQMWKLQKVPACVTYQLQSLKVILMFQREFPEHHHTLIVVPIWKCRR